MKKIIHNKKKILSLQFRELINKSTIIVFLLLPIITIASCKTTSELSYTDKKEKAEKSIALAKSVNAPQYAPQEFNAAIEHFDNGNKYISQNENIRALSNFTTSIDYANQAYTLSLEPYVKDLINETDMILIEATEVLKNIALFEKAVEINQDANEEYDKGNYLDAKEKTLEARESVEIAYRYAEEQERKKREEEQRKREEREGLIQEDLIFNKRVLKEGERFYQVKYDPDDRDCLWKIAEREIGYGSSWKRLYNRNDDIISNPDLIYPGQNLIIPKINN